MYFSTITKEDKKKDRNVKLRDKVYANYKRAIEMHELSLECRAWREELNKTNINNSNLATLAMAAMGNKTAKELNKAAEEWGRFVSANPL